MSGSKKYKNKLCVYCRKRKSTTADHVFSREFFQIEQRDLLPKVPSCEVCNNEKAILEHYLTTVLPFGAIHSNAKKALSVDVKKRLNKNKKLSNELENSMVHKVLQTPENTYVKRLTIQFDHKYLDNLVSYIVKGLIWYHFDKYLPLGCPEEIFTPAPSEMEFVASLFKMSSKLQVSENLGDGTIRYMGLVSEIDEEVSVWKVQFLGGMTVSDSESKFIFVNSFVTMITG